MSTNAIPVVERQLEAYNRLNVEDFIACYSADVQLFDLLSGECFVRGREAMRAYYTRRFASPGLHARIAQRMSLADCVIDHEQITGFPGREGAIYEAIAIYHVSDDLIDRAWFIRG